MLPTSLSQIRTQPAPYTGGRDQGNEKPQARAEQCRDCGHELAGRDLEPRRHPVTEIPLVIIGVTENYLRALSGLQSS